jgi:hypothetical protein
MLFAAVREVRKWPVATNFLRGRYVSFRGEAEVGRAAESAASVENDPGRVKTLRGITAPGILRLVVTLRAPGILRLVVTPRAKKCKNPFSAQRYNQIRFRFHTA